MASLVIIITLVLLALIGFILRVLFVYQNKQMAYVRNLQDVRASFAQELLNTKLEIQEETFQNISREIHDNINLSLTLAKLNLNTISWEDIPGSKQKIASSIDLLGDAINDLSDISRCLNADIIRQDGIIKALEDEIRRIRISGLFQVNVRISGEPVFMSAQNELILFRVLQEAFNNIIKHARASFVAVSLHYDPQSLFVSVIDNGVGFDQEEVIHKGHAGISNMETRIRMLEGNIRFSSFPNFGTTLSLTIPYRFE